MLLSIALGFWGTLLVFSGLGAWLWSRRRRAARHRAEVALAVARRFSLAARVGEEEGLGLFGWVDGVRVEMSILLDGFLLSAPIAPSSLFQARPERSPGAIFIVDRQDAEEAPHLYEAFELAAIATEDEAFDRTFLVSAAPPGVAHQLSESARQVILAHHCRGLSIKEYQIAIQGSYPPSVPACESAVQHLVSLARALASQGEDGQRPN